MFVTTLATPRHMPESRTTTADVNVYMNPINNEEAIKRHRVVVADVVEAVDAGKH